MKPFEFRLQTLLKLRQGERDQRRSELAEAFHAFDILEHQEDDLRTQHEDAVVQKTKLQAVGQIAVDQIIDHQRFQLLVAAQIKQIGSQKQRIQEEIERRREALVEADRDVRALEKLKEKQFEKYTQAMARDEVKEFDEIAMQRNVRATGG